MIEIGKKRRDRDLDYNQKQNEESLEEISWWTEELEVKEIRDKLIEEIKGKEESQEEISWWLKESETKVSQEKLIKQIKTMQMAQKGIPKWMFLAQFFAMTYIVVNIWLLYANVTSPLALYIGAYMIPLVLVLFHYIITLGQLKQIARGGK